MVTTDGPPSERYRFAHALVRDAVYERTSAPQRVRLHAAIAAAIETNRPSVWVKDDDLK
jgi:predicted ATPase